MNNMISFLYINAETYGNRRQNDYSKPWLRLEIIYQALAAVLTVTFSTGITIDNNRSETKFLVYRMLKFTL
ncbi:hypothetical protein BN128_2203 [Cronobacter sakazakii 696]|nr:hypothetical protein BN128_2203 [Cronobacter sakazakii 696]